MCIFFSVKLFLPVLDAHWQSLLRSIFFGSPSLYVSPISPCFFLNTLVQVIFPSGNTVRCRLLFFVQEMKFLYFPGIFLKSRLKMLEVIAIFSCLSCPPTTNYVPPPSQEDLFLRAFTHTPTDPFLFRSLYPQLYF